MTDADKGDSGTEDGDTEGGKGAKDGDVKDETPPAAPPKKDDVPKLSKEAINDLAWRFLGFPVVITNPADFVPKPVKDVTDEGEEGFKKREFADAIWRQKVKESFDKYQEDARINPGSGKRIGTVTGTIGDVEWTQPGSKDWVRLEKDVKLPEGAWLRTGSGSKIDFEYLDGTQLRVGSGTAVQIGEHYKDNRSLLQKAVDWILGPNEETKEHLERIKERSERLKTPGAVVGPIGAVPQEYRIALERASHAHPPTEELSGTTLESARPLVPGEFYVGQLAPGGRAFGRRELKKGEEVRFRVYVRLGWASTTYQALTFQVADSYGGMLERQNTTTSRAQSDLFDVWKPQFKATADGVHFFRFEVDKSHAFTPLDLRIVVES